MKANIEQNVKNHIRLVPAYHFVLLTLLLAGLIGSLINLYHSINSHNLYSASLIALLFICTFIIATLMRSFALKAQDRAIRAEENLRYFILTGKALPQLGISQITALRFASDEEFPGLTEKALKENLSNKQIKKAISNWRPDFYRV
jgi:hypothetical protein